MRTGNPTLRIFRSEALEARGDIMPNPLPDLDSVCFLDMETTGLDPHREKIVTFKARHLQKLVEEGKIAKLWIPERFMVCPEALPKTSTGKLVKKPLREKYSEILTDA